MDVNSIIDQFYNFVGSYLYFVFGLIFIFIGVLIKGKVSLVFYVFGVFVFFKEFGFVDIFFFFFEIDFRIC